MNLDHLQAIADIRARVSAQRIAVGARPTDEISVPYKVLEAFLELQEAAELDRLDAARWVNLTGVALDDAVAALEASSNGEDRMIARRLRVSRSRLASIERKISV